ncbi:Major facilitator superfamily domain-containing protein 4A [Galemys pyrenaicus]|uniref:Major facilitator superfamily domain-containing protein 4A n=1 Tax=Galemys pyrenaicus TaxID=202257 RepID=A0A8J6AFL0_GALPY|nr:Major facilitator superfamily domain-containing protein 4A [Galemys pyrenaicus]
MGCDGRVSGLLRRHLQPTLTYWSVFFSVGLGIAFLGPTLLDLRCQTHSSLPQISWVFFSQQLCLLLGSALGGVFKRTLAQSLWVLFASSLAISLVFAVIPFCHNVRVLAAVMALAGLAMGCIDTVANMQLVRIYQKDSAVFLQALHFFVGFGALLSPLIADPFLSETSCLPANSTGNVSSAGHLFHASRVLGQRHPEARPQANQTLPTAVPGAGAGTRVSYAFWIMALINVSAAGQGWPGPPRRSSPAWAEWLRLCARRAASLGSEEPTSVSHVSHVASARPLLPGVWRHPPAPSALAQPPQRLGLFQNLNMWLRVDSNDGLPSPGPCCVLGAALGAVPLAGPPGPSHTGRGVSVGQARRAGAGPGCADPRRPQLPVPSAVLFLLSKERLLTCCPQRRPLLLSADELALETQPPGTEDASSLSPQFQPHAGHGDLLSWCQREHFRGAPCSFFAIHIAAALVLFMTDGMTGAYSAFVYSYAVEKPLSVGHKAAGYLPSLFWGFITLGRLVSIPISSRVKPATMVFVNVVGVVLTFLVLLVLSSSVVFLFVGTASLGLFLSSTFPSMLAYTEDVLQYKGCATTVLVTGAGIGEMTLQMLVGSVRGPVGAGEGREPCVWGRGVTGHP